MLKTIVKSLFICTVLITPMMALAIDTKTIGGNACKPEEIPFIRGGHAWGLPYPAQGTPLWTSPPSHSKGDTNFVFKTPSISVAKVVCPIVRDSVTNTLAVQSIKVWVHDDSATTEVRCGIFVEPIGGVGYSSTKGTGNSHVSPNAQTSSSITWTSTDLPSTYNGGPITMVCVGNGDDVIGAIVYKEGSTSDAN